MREKGHPDAAPHARALVLWEGGMRIRPTSSTFVSVLAAGLLTGCPDSPRDDDVDFGGTADDDDDDDDDESTGGDPDTGDESGDTGPDGCEEDEDCGADETCDPLSGECLGPCSPGDEMPCYSGPPNTEGVGACQAGVYECDENGEWDLVCENEVLPGPEDCESGEDDDCDGLVDDSDIDGDGFGACSTDCCDVDGGACSDAALVNPGAYEVVGNELDDDCDGEIDEEQSTCDEGLASDTTDAQAFARAMELCQFTEEDPEDPADRTWGIIDASLTLADGTGTPLAVQHALRGSYGDLIDPEEGDTMVVLSSGHAAGVGDSDPDYAPFQPGEDLDSVSDAPADWLEANGGEFPNPAGCTEPWSTDANDSAMLTIRLRAPTNANSFSVRMFFFSAEWPEWVCSAFNDFFVTLVGGTADNPEDRNIAIFDDGDTVWPVGVNLAGVAEGLFGQCENGTVGCEDEDSPITDYDGCVGVALLEGTGFDESDDGCGGGQTIVGGGTGWLTMSGNVTPGEVFEVRFAIWDSSGHIFDSLVLLDDWEWSVDAADPGVAPG